MHNSGDRGARVLQVLSSSENLPTAHGYLLHRTSASASRSCVRRVPCLFPGSKQEDYGCEKRALKSPMASVGWNSALRIKARILSGDSRKDKHQP